MTDIDNGAGEHRINSQPLLKPLNLVLTQFLKGIKENIYISNSTYRERHPQYYGLGKDGIDNCLQGTTISIHYNFYNLFKFITMWY